MAPALVPLVLCACVILYGKKPDYYESVMLCGNTLHDHSGCNINTRNIGRLLLISINVHPTTVNPFPSSPSNWLVRFGACY